MSTTRRIIAFLLLLQCVPAQTGVAQDEQSEDKVFAVPGLGRFYLQPGNDYVQGFLKNGRIWEADHQTVFAELVKPHFRVVDAGAYVGSHTVRLAQLAYEGSVFAFEPQADIVDLLQRNMELNQLTNVSVFPVALGETNCSTSMQVNLQNKGATPIQGCQEDSDGIPVRTLDSFDLGPIDFMKIDVEGYEVPLLEGARQTIMTHRPVMMIESGVNRQAELFAKLRELSYSWREFKFQEFIAHPLSLPPD